MNGQPHKFKIGTCERDLTFEYTSNEEFLFSYFCDSSEEIGMSGTYRYFHIEPVSSSRAFFGHKLKVKNT